MINSLDEVYQKLSKQEMTIKSVVEAYKNQKNINKTFEESMASLFADNRMFKEERVRKNLRVLLEAFTAKLEDVYPHLIPRLPQGIILIIFLLNHYPPI